MPKPRRGDFDRSLAFTALLEICPWFGPLESRQGEREVTAFLEAFHGQDRTLNMVEFARTWRQKTRS